MIPSGIAKRYADALFSTAMRKNIAGEIEDNCKQFVELLTMNPGFKQYILSPQVRTEQKLALLDSSLGGSVSPMFMRFVHLLIQKERFAFMEEIAAAYIELHERHRGIQKAVVVTAVPLDESLKQKLITKLEQETRKTIRLKTRVNPEIIGGMIVILNNTIIDGSVIFKLERMRSTLREVKVY
ncbi:MAG: ATP synthase F1 subunit delta [Chitinivibrionia bacterium]|nr:ATP synthase F1 subunit delta [Chitinivibrionia bacterium]